MDLQISAEYDLFRDEVRDFLRLSLPPGMAARNLRGFHGTQEDRQAWTRILARKGWSGPAWPAEHGGPGWDPLRVMIFEEECLLAGAPEVDIAGFRLVGPVIYTFGTEEQKGRFLPPTRSGEIFWSQGFSEPNAGSDLASLSTRAVRDGDGYVVDGRKIWTSNAHLSDYIFALVKTAPEAKQRGISFIIIETRAPGVTIRPIIDIGEGHSLNEVFLDDVRVPAENLIGEENGGWSYGKFLLDNERAFSAEVPRNKANLRRLKQLAGEALSGRGRLLDDAVFASRVAELEVDLHALEYLTLRALTEKAGGTDLPVGSMLKIRGSELLQRIGELQIEALGDYGAVVYTEDPDNVPQPGPPGAPGALADFLYRRSTTIYGGANEIQRTIIARSFLGL
jgi:alkylation response protein AidB-like acyl-CoA dehydrogenase